MTQDENMAGGSKLGFEYRTTFTVIPDSFPEDHEMLPKHLGQISPKAPKTGVWQLAGSTTITRINGQQMVLYFWERDAVARPNVERPNVGGPYYSDMDRSPRGGPGGSFRD